MTTAWIIFGTAVVLAFALSPWWDIMNLLPGIISVCAAVVALFVGIWMLSLHYDRATCHAWAHQSGRASKFAYYNAFSWECLARAHDGKWVPKSQIGDFNK